MNTYKLVPLLLDMGNIAFAIGTFPQLHRTYVNRHSLKDLSIKAFILFTIATGIFFIVGLLTGAWFTIALTTFNIFYNLLTVYWIWRARK